MTKLKFTHAEKKAFLEEYKYDTEALWRFVNENENHPWNWPLLLHNPTTFGIVKETPVKKWDLRFFEDVKEKPDDPWDKPWGANPPNFTLKDVKENPDGNWDLYWLSMNPDITFEDVKNNPNIRWNWGCLSNNPNITIDIIKENPNKHWNWDWLSCNKFFYDDTVFNREYIKVKTKEKQAFTEKILYENTDICPDIIKEITRLVEL